MLVSIENCLTRYSEIVYDLTVKLKLYFWNCYLFKFQEGLEALGEIENYILKLYMIYIALLSDKEPIIMVVGGKNSGKSTLNRYLINHTLNKYVSSLTLDNELHSLNEWGSTWIM